MFPLYDMESSRLHSKDTNKAVILLTSPHFSSLSSLRTGDDATNCYVILYVVLAFSIIACTLQRRMDYPLIDYKMPCWDMRVQL